MSMCVPPQKMVTNLREILNGHNGVIFSPQHSIISSPWAGCCKPASLMLFAFTGSAEVVNAECEANSQQPAT